MLFMQAQVTCNMASFRSLLCMPARLSMRSAARAAHFYANTEGLGSAPHWSTKHTAKHHMVQACHYHISLVCQPCSILPYPTLPYWLDPDPSLGMSAT